ncbi:MAG TPA: hypothetical protein VLT17_00715 [Gemmatimonadales bacterium]|nr:hypothetical protein [Gemmatimonadales bacterium]
MDIEGILAIVLIFGGGVVAALSFSPIGRAIADRIRGRAVASGTDPAVLEELDRLRQEMTELQERVDFAERMLAQGKQAERLPGVS